MVLLPHSHPTPIASINATELEEMKKEENKKSGKVYSTGGKPCFFLSELGV